MDLSTPILFWQVINFSTDIFKTAGLSESNSTGATMGIGLVNVLMTLVSMVLIEKAGRKTLLTAGFVGMIFSTVLLTVALTFAVSILLRGKEISLLLK